MEVDHKHGVRQSAKGGFGAAFGAVFGKFFGCIGVILFIIVLIAMLSMCSGDKSENSSKPSGPPVDVTAADLSKAFQTNEAKAKLDYDGKTLNVSGAVKEIDLNIADNPVIKLRGSGDAYGMGLNSDGKITDVSANGLTKEDAAKINKGQKVTLTCGSVDEVMGGPQLQNCSLKP